MHAGDSPHFHSRGNSPHLHPGLEIIIPSLSERNINDAPSGAAYNPDSNATVKHGIHLLSQRSINNAPSDVADDLNSNATVRHGLPIAHAPLRYPDWHLSSIETQSSCASNQAINGNLDAAIEQSPAPYQSPAVDPVPSPTPRQVPQVYLRDEIDRQVQQAGAITNTYLEQRDELHLMRIASNTGIILLSAAARPMIEKLIEKLSDHDHRFIGAVGAAHTALAAAPTVITCALCAFGMYKIDSLLHAEERANFIVLKKELDDRFNAINSKIESGVSNWQSAQVTINEISTKLETISTNDQRMQDMLHRQILPSLYTLKDGLQAWRLDREIKDIAPALPQEDAAGDLQLNQPARHKKTMSEKLNKRITKIFSSK